MPKAPATFVFYDGDSLMGLPVLHVDDGLIAGEGAAFEQAVEQRRGRALLHKWGCGAINLTGRQTRQFDGFRSRSRSGTTCRR